MRPEASARLSVSLTGAAQHARVPGRGQQVRMGGEVALESVGQDLIGIVDHAVHAAVPWTESAGFGGRHGAHPATFHDKISATNLPSRPVA